LMRHVPGATGTNALRLFHVALLVGSVLAVALVAALAIASVFTRLVPALDAPTWTLAGLMAVLLIVTWLQDAYYLGLGTARPTFRRNVVLGVARVVVIVPLVLFASPQPVALAGLVAVAVSAAFATAMGRGIARTSGRAAVPPVADATF